MAPIKKSEVLSTQNEEVQKLYALVEATLNSKLKTSATATYCLKNVLTHSAALKKTLVDLVKKNFEAAGWTVNRISGNDFRGDDSWDYLSIS